MALMNMNHGDSILPVNGAPILKLNTQHRCVQPWRRSSRKSCANVESLRHHPPCCKLWMLYPQCVLPQRPQAVNLRGISSLNLCLNTRVYIACEPPLFRVYDLWPESSPPLGRSHQKCISLPTCRPCPLALVFCVLCFLGI